MAEYEARPSTDQESAPLLRNPEDEENSNGNEPRPGLAKRLTEVVQEPLTGLTKVLLVEVLILLIIASVFIGLFAGAQHKLNLRGGGGGGGSGDQTETVTVTSTTASTIISATTTTAVSTAIRTTTDTTTTTKTATKTATKTEVKTSVSTYTTTDVRTHTVIVGPEPTGPPAPPGTPPSDTCLTPDCIVLSASILSSLDTTQDPCENFYDFANGGWISSHPIPGDKGGISNFQVVAEKNGQLLQKLLETKPKFPSQMDSYDEQLLGKLRTLYGSCMDESKLDYIGQQPLRRFVDTIKRLYRGEGTNVDFVNRQGLSNAVAFLHSRGVEALFEFSVDGDAGVDPNAMTLWFSQPSLGLPAKEYYKEQPILDTYQKVIERLLITLYDDQGLMSSEKDASLPKHAPMVIQAEQTEDSDHVWPPWPWPPWDGDDDQHRDSPKPPRDPLQRAHELAKQVVDFETEIAEATLDLDLLQQDPFGTYNPLQFNTLKAALPNINFPDYFATFTPRAFPSRVIVTYKPYPYSLSDILSKYSADVVEAYLVVRAALAYAPNLGTTTESWKAVRTLQETLGGLKKGAVGDRSEFCMKQVESALGFATGRFFVNQTFPGESKDKATKVITDIIEAFENSLTRLPWMDEESARRATEKAEALRVKVGFPMFPNTLDPRSIVNYYTLVKVHTDTFFDNMLSAASSEVYKMWQKLGKRRNLDEWEMFASTVNAYYNPPGNEIVFPAGILQPPFFSQNWPGYLSYGSFGMVAAHELTHAFDSSGRLYNQQGKLEEWWTPETSEGYQVKQDCIVRQYSCKYLLPFTSDMAYTVDDGKGGVVHVNGNLTSGENIGDTGLIQAYRAWKAQYEDSYDAGQEYLLPGLDYTREQLFFISFARTWAMNNRPADAVQRVRSDPHSPNRYRTEGTVFNIPEFAKAFQCSARAKLNPPPERQCIFWS
ncbi:zincin [Leucogyrophana mollusca]|uniref:Zincin n=1 Tax=Leucogyrophana mollusca TaxID=85980 RepID=A0ACB8BXM6_9AGAM|nr:zincin [Leucogyrophana mollusca]